MPNSKWTPGPWTLQTRERDKAYQIAVFGNVEGGPVARIECCVEGGTSFDNANASLIAAAPEMAEALARVSCYFEQHGTAETQGIACDVFEALRKARGEER